jgi:hypothetical protein
VFEYLFQQLYQRLGARLTEHALVYFHYGVVNALREAAERVKEQPFPVQAERMMELTVRERQALADIGFYVEKESGGPWLNPLIDSIAKIKQVELQPQTREYLNRLVVATANAVLNEAANIAAKVRPDIMLILPEDLETACLGIFKEKPWFIC